MSAIPPSTSVLKPCIKYLQQAKQVEKVEPIIAYYCRLYALQMGMKIPGRSKDDLKLIGEQMNWLEKNQHLVANLNKEEGRAKAEGFALQVFSFADNEDRAGLATKKTALNFHAAYVLMDICRQFSPTSELASDIEEKLRYAIVKAADINKALKEGRKPKAGPLNEPSAEDESSAGDDALLATLSGAPTSNAMRPSSTTSTASSAPHFGTAASPFPSTSSTSNAPYQPQPTPAQQPYNPYAASNPTANAPPTASTAAYGQPISGEPSSAFPFLNPTQDAPPAQPSAAYNPFPSAMDGFNPTPLPDPNSLGGHIYSNPYGGVLPSSFNPHATSSASAPPASSTPVNPTPFSKPAHSPPPSSSPTPGRPPSASSGGVSPFSAAGTAARNSGVSGSVGLKKDTKKIDAVRDSERLIKHALSAVAFSDIDTTVLKLKEALNLLQPYSTK